MSPTLKHNAVRAKSGGACRHAYFADTLIRVGVTSTRTPLRLRKKAMNASGSSVENTPLICIFRSAGVAISIGFGLIPIVSPSFFHIFPAELKPIFGDGIILTAISAVSLNAFFNHTTQQQAEAGAFLAAQAAEHI